MHLLEFCNVLRYNYSMNPIYIILIIFAALAFIFFAVCYVCFRLTFYVPEKEKKPKEFSLPPGDIYLPYHKQMLAWMQEAKTFPCERVQIKSKDGKTLCGTYYEFFKDGMIEIMFHGYRGSTERDLCGGLQRCIQLKRNAILVEQRGHGDSDGNVLSFGIKERYDACAWAEYAYARFGEDVKLLLTGISMGAATVVMASSLPLPKTVVGVIADCGYSSPKDIICTVVKKMKLPPRVFYPLIRLGGKIFGKFDIDETSPMAEAEKSNLPILFIHGDADDFVPCQMSEMNFNACKAEKGLEIFPGAGHGMSYLLDPERYVNVLKEFEKHYE